MRKMVTLTLVFLIFSGSVAFTESESECKCDSGPCHCSEKACEVKERSFGVPLGSIVSIVAALIEKSIPPGVSLLIPSVEITLSRSISGETWAKCPSPCCLGEQGLTMFVDLELDGTGTSSEYLRSSFSFTQSVRVKTVEDNKAGDDLTTPCEISTDFNLTTAGLSIKLTFLGIVEIELQDLLKDEPKLKQIARSTKGKVNTGLVRAQCTCGKVANQRPDLVTPQEEVIVPIGGRVTFEVEGTDDDGNALWYSVSPSVAGGVTVSIDQNGTITVDATHATVKDGDTGVVLVCVYDLKGGVVSDPPQEGEYYHVICDLVDLKFTSNKPPDAPDVEHTVHVGVSPPDPESVLQFFITDPDGDTVYTNLPLGCKLWEFAQFLPGVPFPEGLLVTIWLYPTKENLGTHRRDYLARDENGLWDEGTLVVRVVNELPIARGDHATTWQATETSIDVLANDSDPDGDPLTIDEISSPLHGTAEIADRGKQIQYTPDPNFVGTDSFTYWITDGCERGEAATVTVKVKDAEPRPYREWVSLEAGESEYVTLQGYVPDGRECDSSDYTFRVGSPQVGSDKWLISAFPSWPPQLSSAVFPVVSQEFLVKTDEDAPPGLYDLRIFLDNQQRGLTGEDKEGK